MKVLEVFEKHCQARGATFEQEEPYRRSIACNTCPRRTKRTNSSKEELTCQRRQNRAIEATGGAIYICQRRTYQRSKRRSKRSKQSYQRSKEENRAIGAQEESYRE